MLANLKQRMATDGDARSGLAGELVAAREDGRIKLYLTHQALRSRRQHPGLFTDGAYKPLEAEGLRKDHAFAFARQKERQWAVVIVPRLTARLAPKAEQLPFGAAWEGTTLRLPETVRNWRNVLTGATLTDESPTPLTEALRAFPSGSARRRGSLKGSDSRRESPLLISR